MVVALLGSLLVGCGGDNGERATGRKESKPPTSTTSTTEDDSPSGPRATLFPTTSPRPTIAAGESGEPAGEEADAEPPRGGDSGDFEGQLYDFGAITAVRREGGRVAVVFNRMQLYGGENSLLSGTDFVEEPIVYGNTDAPYVDTSPKTRTFYLAPDAMVLRIEDPVPCADEPEIREPTWANLSVADLVGGAWRDRLEDTLSFSPGGLVSQVRLSTAC